MLVEHRGHRLGGLVEAAVLRQVARALPQVRTITTSTAETTTPMVAVDEALGFVPTGALSSWSARL